MSMDYIVDPEQRLVRAAIKGETTFAEWRQAMDAILADRNFRPGFGFLIDLSDIANAPDTAFIRQVAGYFMGHKDRLGGGRRAIVVTVQSIYGMARMEEILAEPSGVAVRPFYRHEEALRWLQTGEE
jgi:hypothetical protein